MSEPKYKRILVTGASGFLGSHVVPALREQSGGEVITVGRADYDLLEPGGAVSMLKDIQPDAVVHMAAKVGGIIANKAFPADFFYDNIMINTQTFEACYRAGIKRFLSFMGGCAYPAKAPSPISEDMLWEGYPQPESAPYSVAKSMMVLQSRTYRTQHGFNSSIVVPGNVYGEYDNFNMEYAHVIPALIRRFLEAKETNAPSVVCYGSGRPTRDFVYAGDVATVVPWFLENYDDSQPVNISTGTRISIKELAETISKVVGYEGELDWDTSKPDGQMDKIFDVTRLHDLGISCDTSLEAGLRKTVAWFLKARDEGAVRL